MVTHTNGVTDEDRTSAREIRPPLLHLVYSTAPTTPTWAQDPDVEERILEFVEEELEKWREELSP